jgi:hypothetical protein
VDKPSVRSIQSPITEFTKILREAEGWWDLGLPQDTWETLESRPCHLPERLLGEGAKLLLQEFLRMAAGLEDPVLVAQYHGAIEGYVFEDAA